jgi:hypothetical protein
VSAVIHDYYCRICDAEAYDKWSDDVPRCCGRKMKMMITSVKTDEWGGPKTYLNLRDEPFASRSELKDWTKKRGLSLAESSEKVGGARNEMYAGIGKIYSIPGVSRGGRRG